MISRASRSSATAEAAFSPSDIGPIAVAAATPAATDTAATITTAAAAAADRLRRNLWRLVSRTAFGRRALRDRSFRLSVLAAGHILAGLALTLVAPLWLLLLGPLVLGVPHAVSDIRFLLLRAAHPWSRVQAAAVLVPLALMTVVRVASLLGVELIVGPGPTLEALFGAAAIFAAVITARGSPRRRASGLVFAGGIGLCALLFPHQLALLFAHFHNLVAIFLWVLWLRAARFNRAPQSPSLQPAIWGISLFACGALALALGIGDRALLEAHSAAGLSSSDLIETLAPGFAPTIALRLVLLYAFAQSVHYALWVRLIPATLAPGPPSPGFRAALASLRSDLGHFGLLACVLAAALVPLVALRDPAGTRSIYLSLILFHGWLELAAGARMLVARAPAA